MLRLARRAAPWLAALGVSATTACSSDGDTTGGAPSAAGGRPTYDVRTGTDGDAALYVPRVDQLVITKLSVAADHGGALAVGHPVALRVEADVVAEPFHATLWYGLTTADGKQRCAIDHVAVDHVGAMYDAAERANLALAAKEAAAQPSLADCAGGAACPEGEECLAFLDHPATTAKAPDDASDPSAVPAEKPLEGPAPEGDEQPVTSYRCSTKSWAQRAAGLAHGGHPIVTPADLAGTVRQTHAFGAEDELPASCAALVGQKDVKAWIAFDPEMATEFAGRPALPKDGVDTGKASADPAHVLEAEAAVAFAERLAMTADVVGVVDDPGLDVDLRLLSTGSSVVPLAKDDHPAGDFTLNADYSLDGTPDAAQKAALANATLSFHFGLRPAGTPRAGCTPPEGVSLEEEKLAVSHPDGAKDSDEEPADTKVLGLPRSKTFPIHVSSALREKLFADWQCFDHFEVKGCLTTSLPQAKMAVDDDCAETAIVLAREAPPENAEVIPPPPPQLPPSKLGDPGCTDALFQSYADNMKKALELENRVTITEYYTYDIMKWVYGSLEQDSGTMKYISPDRRSMYFAYVKGYLKDCEDWGGQSCWTSWYFKNSPWNIDVNHFTSQTLPYFWNAWGRSGAENYLKYKNDPQAFTKSGFDYECAGIASGSVCSEIGYDLARVPELAKRIKDVLLGDKRSDPLAAKISPNGAGRCLGRAYPALQRTTVGDNGKVTTIPEDEVFYTKYLEQVCEKGKYKKAADDIWAKIAASCTYVSKPFSDTAAGIYTGRFVPELYRTYNTGYKNGVQATAEGGVVNDYFIATQQNQFKLVFGAQGRIYLSTQKGSTVEGWLDVYDIFKTWLLANIYSDLVSSYVDAGFHVLTHDVWKISFKLPSGEYSLPEPPELAKEVEKCRYLWKAPMPFRIELCGAVGGKVSLDVAATLSKSGLEGVDPGKADWPGMAGTVTPGIALTSKGRAGIDVFIASAGLGVSLDPTIGLFIPVQVGAKWNLGMKVPKQLSWTIAPYVKVDLEIKALGGTLFGYTKWNIGSTKEETYDIIDWDPLELAKWNLYAQEWPMSGVKTF
jgi:hypothetical protein